MSISFKHYIGAQKVSDFEAFWIWNVQPILTHQGCATNREANQDGNLFRNMLRHLCVFLSNPFTHTLQSNLPGASYVPSSEQGTRH